MSVPTAIVTGASSGGGLHVTKALTDRGWHVAMACRNLEKARAAATSLRIAAERTTLLPIGLGAQESVRRFAAAFHGTGLPLDALGCNAAAYLPLPKRPARLPEGYEINVATNHLGHFLLCGLLLDALRGAVRQPARLGGIQRHIGLALDRAPGVRLAAWAELQHRRLGP